MRTKTFRPYDQDSLLLMPPSVRDWVEPDGLAAFISDLVDELDLSAFLAAHDEPRGMPPYHPALMLKVLLYGYATGVRSSRRIEEHLRSDVDFMYLSGQARPDYKTISQFRRRHLTAFRALFLEVLALCDKAGLVKLGRVALDGTKIRANASKHKAMSYGRMVTRETELAAQVNTILREAEATDAAEDKLYGDARGDELPPELRTREGRLRKIREAKEALEREARERTGDPEAVPDPKTQRNFTDPESKIMRSRTEGWVQAYNAGAVVDEKAQVIVATTLSADPTDSRSLPTLVDAVEANAGRRPKRVLADAGYCSAENIDHLKTAGIDGYIATGRESHGPAGSSSPRGRTPAHLTPTQRMSRKLSTKAGHAHYARRKAIVEPVFGQIKEAAGFRRFSLRGLGSATGEWQLVCAVHNIGKLFRSGQASRVLPDWSPPAARRSAWVLG
jgi:transposase